MLICIYYIEYGDNRRFVNNDIMIVVEGIQIRYSHILKSEKRKRRMTTKIQKNGGWRRGGGKF